MTKIKIVTGNGHALSKDLVKRYKIGLFDYPVYLEGKQYQESNTDREIFLEDIKEKQGFPKTSAPSVAKLAEVFRNLYQQGYEIFLVLMSERLTSATYMNARQAKKMCPEARVKIIDTKQTAMGKDLIVLEIARFVEQGRSREEILAAAEEIVVQTNSILALPDMEYLYRGGRIGRAKALFGSLVKIVPLVGLRNQEGVFGPLGKARTIKQANEMMVKQIKDDMKNKGGKHIGCMVGDINNEIAVEILRNVLRESFRDIERIEGEIGCTAVCHMGPGSWGIGYRIKK